MHARFIFLFIFCFFFLPISLSPFSTAVGEGDYIRVLREISSPFYKGRGVGEGLDLARDYLLKEMKNIGLEGSFPEGKYLQEFPVFKRNIMGKNNFLGDSRLEEDFIPLSFSISGKMEETPLVFAGFGISFDGVYDDYAGIDVKGKIVIVLTGDPAIGSSESIFRDPAYYHYSQSIYKVQNALNHSASGIILVRNPLSFIGDEEAPLHFSERSGGGAVFDILAGMSTNAYINRFLKEESLLDIQKKIALTQKPRSFFLHELLPMGIELERELGNIQNIVGLLPGTDPNLKEEYIVVGAHYDHLGLGGESSREPGGGIGKVHHGADDNASGVDAILHIAKNIQGKNRRPVLFCLFTGEELGLLGSRHFVENLPLEEGSKIVAMLNLDMVGRMKSNRLIIMAQDSAHEFGELIGKSRKDIDIDLIKGPNNVASSDHAPFLRNRIPAVFFHTGVHSEYHRPSDTQDKIEVEGLKKVVSFSLNFLKELDSLEQGPTYNKDLEDEITPPRTGRGYGSYFGSIPSFEQSGVEGVLLDGVKVDSPAAKVGLQKGDILTALGEIKIANLHNFVFALRFYRPKEEVLVDWIRDGVSMEGKVVLESRELQRHRAQNHRDEF